MEKRVVITEIQEIIQQTMENRTKNQNTNQI